MNEQSLLNEINNKLKKRISVDVDIRVLLLMWFGNKGFNDNDVYNKLKEFSENNGLDYLSVLQGRRVISVRFWKIKAKELLEEPNELQD